MTDIQKLKVSLTKHGSHKLATLLQHYPAKDVMQHLEGSIPGVNIESVQAKKNLSVSSDGKVPGFWQEAKELGNDVIDGLVLLAIIFSHFKLIGAMSNSSIGGFKGRIVRNIHLTEKEFTNFSHILEQLGYATITDYKYVEYDLAKLFAIPSLNSLAKKMLATKLIRAGWDNKNSLEDEMVELQFHKAISLSEEQFRSWVGTGKLVEMGILSDNDEEFFTAASEEGATKQFAFSSGHNPKTEGTVVVSVPQDKTTANLLHNQIQNRMFKYLVAVHGKDKVGTEIDTGFRTSIDVVVSEPEGLTFYEIKTATVIKASIRQALPQLLEYAYWPNTDKAKRLVIVSHLPTTKDAETYLRGLREKFGIPIHYQQFDLSKNKLV